MKRTDLQFSEKMFKQLSTIFNSMIEGADDGEEVGAEWDEKTEEELLKQLTGESIIFSCPIEKKNNWGVWQERRLVITDHAMYNVKDGQAIQRRIRLNCINALSRCVHQEGLLQFVVHVRDEYDYHLRSLNADDLTFIILQVETAYQNINKKDLPIYLVPEELEEHMTTKDKARDGEFTLPPHQWLLKRQTPSEPTEELKSQEAGITLRDTMFFGGK